MGEYSDRARQFEDNQSTSRVWILCLYRHVELDQVRRATLDTKSHLAAQLAESCLTLRPTFTEGDEPDGHAISSDCTTQCSCERGEGVLGE
eukprot:scaffold136219_cov33-Tisochrysis_lutea.AAC.4